jgi:hypothetical protein
MVDFYQKFDHKFKALSRKSAGDLIKTCFIYSGCRTLAGITGDWSPIDQLARECLAWFKFVNRMG